MLVEGTHFHKGENLKNIGRKAAAVSLSDIAAMGGIPLYITVSLGIPGFINFRSVQYFYKGLFAVLDHFNVKLIGGDTVRSPYIVVDTCVIGINKSGKILKRKGAKTGDFIFTTGYFGSSLSTGWHYNFLPRIKEVLFLKKNMHITSAIDASDGLYASLRTLGEESDVKMQIEAHKIPFRKQKKFFKSSLQSALFDGEDFEIVFTGNCRNFKLVSEKFKKLFNIPLNIIGKVYSGRGVKIIDSKGQNIYVKNKEFQHFKK